MNNALSEKIKVLTTARLYLHNGNENYPFAFKVNRSDSDRKLTIGIYAMPQSVSDNAMQDYEIAAKDFVGMYEIINLDNHNLTIRCEHAKVTNVGYINNYDTREIIAQR